MGRATVAEQVKGQKQGGMRVYICEHNTSPPENQHIKTDQQNILIRSLMLNNNKGGSSSKDVKAAAEGPRKRFAHQSSMVKKYINVNDEVSVVAALVLHTKRNDVVSEGSRKNDEEKEGLKSANDDVEGEEKKIEEDYEQIDGKSCKLMVHGVTSKTRTTKKMNQTKGKEVQRWSNVVSYSVIF
ncbi:hypothetical protein E1A91_D09G278000v1 [Gossypium mustelinum]|uniref:DET1- and DDB1-associated protein 1 domain-containing protein n=1 Tax=Gossypium mustelinum TaxID=34275 RepID=A0A5D2TQ29_GOSMU|nr:hypothetical protein E1A91_D09G278000v1 [Gossypium mustelinum]TYI67141.1 hypothetical protein E1A91_D09G278000v1 [Gossypium mustelinum]